MKKIISFVLIFLFFNWEYGTILAQAVQDKKQDKKNEQVCRFTNLPDPDYFDRNFELKPTTPFIRDLTDLDSDEVINSYPQGLKGFMTGWVKPCQKIVSVDKPTEVEMFDGACRLARAVLKPGESVLTDSEGEILAVIRCANKVIKGRAAALPFPVVSEEKPADEIFKDIHKNRDVIRREENKVIIINNNPPSPLAAPTQQPFPKKSNKKRNIILGLLISGAIAGVAFAIASGGGGDDRPTPIKPFPDEGVISPP